MRLLDYQAIRLTKNKKYKTMIAIMDDIVETTKVDWRDIPADLIRYLLDQPAIWDAPYIIT